MQSKSDCTAMDSSVGRTVPGSSVEVLCLQLLAKEGLQLLSSLQYGRQTAQNACCCVGGVA